MPIQFLLRINSPDEIHVLPGHPSWDLITECYSVSHTTDPIADINVFLAANPTARFSFSPQFMGLMAPTGPGADAVFEAFNVRVNLTKGRIEAIPTAGPPIRNFLIEVKLEHDGVVLTDLLRVHMHDHVEDAWLTPSPNHYRRTRTGEAATVKHGFSFRARFDDGTVGDITFAKGNTWTPTDRINQFATASIDIKSTDPDDHIIPVSASFHVGPTTITRSADLRILKAWSDEPAPRAKLIPGSARPVLGALQSRPNVLFLGDGLLQSDATAFHDLISGMVKKMAEPLFSPYDRLLGSMHFWSVVCPSPASSGIPIAREVNARTTGGTTTTELVPRPVPPSGPIHVPRAWTLRELIYTVGLPILSDHADHLPKRTDSDILTSWDRHFGWKETFHTGPISTLLTEWRSLAHRGLADEVNSGAGTAIPEVGPSSTGTAGFKEGMDRDQLDRFIERIEGVVLDGSGNNLIATIGHLWRSSSPTGALGSMPDDVGLVVIVQPQLGRAVNSVFQIFLPILDQPAVVKDAATNRYTLAPAQLPLAIDLELVKATLHELSHSFGCGDEYGERIGPPVTPPSLNSNLQLEASAMRPVQLPGETAPRQRIHGDAIQWRWPRARHAAVINGTITGSITSLLVPVADGMGAFFIKGNMAVLRERVPRRSLAKDPLMSPLFRVRTISADLIELEPFPGTFAFPNMATGPDLLTRFTVGSLLMELRPPPAHHQSPAHPFSELLPKSVRNYITANNAPLTPWIEAPPGTFSSRVDDRDVQIPDLGRSSHQIVAKGPDLPRLVGLYSGGRAFHKGIFHPSGHCMMRGPTSDHKEYCAVCRYIIVDMIDPTKHAEIDRLYEKHYPDV